VKTNPRKVPRTQADVARAWQEGADFGAEFAINMVLLVLKDKHDAPDEDILQLRSEFEDQLDSVAKGYINYADIKTALGGDYNIKVRMKR